MRNKLIDEVYLPLIGDNLAKQIGAAGDKKRSDRMGLLLLISPPGYGKTTLMEYVANRLGLVFVKVNGPALGTERWESIKYAYVESVRMKGIEGDDNTVQALRILGGLRDGLEAIRRTMAQVIGTQQPDQQLQLIEQSVTKLTNGLSHLTENVSAAIKVGAEQMQTASQTLPDQKVLVQHSVPRVMTDLVQSQFQLLYDGLRPVLESSTHNRSQLEAIRKSIEDCLKQYRDLKAEIDKAS